ncbi:MAG: homing endonuclease associated repeat-containing protein [Thermoleophilaceae bacterium]
MPGRSISALVEGCRDGLLRYAAHERLRSTRIGSGDLLYLGGFADGRLALLGRIAVQTVAEPAEASALLGERVDAFCAIGGSPFTEASADRVVPHSTARKLRSASGAGLRFTREREYELHPAALLGVLELDVPSGSILDALLREVEAPEAPAPLAGGGGPPPGLEELGPRAVNSLARAGVGSLPELAEMTEAALLAMPAFGAGSLREVRTVLARHGLAPRRAEAPAPAGAGSFFSPAEPSAAKEERAAWTAQQPAFSARGEEIVRRRTSGETLAQIGASLGISRERVRQIAKSSGGPDGRRAGEARRRQARKQAYANRTAILEAWRAGINAREIASQQHMSMREVEDFIRAEAGEQDLAARTLAKVKSRTPAACVFSDAELVDAVRTAAGSTRGLLSSAEYGRIARTRGLPSLQTLTNRLGSWNEALAAAGSAPPAAHRSYTRRWTEESCLDAVRRVAVEEGRLPTVQRYEAIAKGRGDLPSSATVRLRLGTWTSVLTLLAD